MVWRTTGRNTFEAYGASLYHRPAEFDAPPLSPAPLSGINRIWLKGEAVDGQILLGSKFTVDACTDEDGCPDPIESILSYDESPFPEGASGTLNPFLVK